MGEHHLVAVGGTGQHVALAFVELAVLCEWFTYLPAIRLWLFDADAGGRPGAGSAWEELTPQVGFLRRPSNRGGSQWADPGTGHQRPYPDVDGAGTFADTVCKDIAGLLFTEDQQSVNFRNGYYGQPAVASTVFGSVLGSSDRNPQLTQLLGVPSTSGVRIVVAGSAVGGTGSGCMPRLVEQLGNSSTMDGRLMALLYLPWFRLEGGDAKAATRNEEMISRMSSGLYYYKEHLRRHSAAVVLGHPDIYSVRSSRAWQGDTQQSLHNDLCLPLYGACLASQHFSATTGNRFGLYSVPRPSTGGFHSDEVPVALADVKDSGRRWSFGDLHRLNLELCNRIFWVAKYLEEYPRFPSRLSSSLDVGSLRQASPSWAKELRQWGEHKRAALARLAPTLQADISVPKTFQDFGTRRPPEGLSSIREWLESETDGTDALASSEAIARRLAKHLADTGLPKAAAVVKATSSVHLLPPRVAASDGSVGVANAAMPIGEPALLAPQELDLLVAHGRVAPRSIPSPRAREFVLDAALAGRLRVDVVKEVVDSRQAPPATAEGKAVEGEAAKLLRHWFLILLGHAAGRVSFGNPLQTARRNAPIDLMAVALPSRPTQVLWTRKDRNVVLIGYTCPETLFVPGALDDQTWDALAGEIAPEEKDACRRAIASWARFFRRICRAAGIQVNGWLDWLLDWAPASMAECEPFGLAPDSVNCSSEGLAGKGIGHSKMLDVRLPLAGGRADGSWIQYFQSLGLNVVNQCPGSDTVAMAIRALLADKDLCPRFHYLREDGSSEERVALWLYPGKSTPQHQTAASLIQERFYVGDSPGSAGLGWVWDVQEDSALGGLAVEVVRDTTVLLPEVGCLLQGVEHRYPDYPVAFPYLDLLVLESSGLDGASAIGEGKADGAKAPGATVSYRLTLRGLQGQIVRTVRVAPDLIIQASCLMWPNFVAPGWLQRYVRVHNLEPNVPLSCWVVSGENISGRVQRSVKVSLTRDPLPVGFTLPGDCAAPRALYLRGKARNYGVYALKMDTVPHGGGEQWGVDFGTSATVVAACADGNPWANAVLLQPSGSCDATLKVLLGAAVTPKSSSWFASWEGLGPRQDAPGLLPTRLIVRDKKAPNVDALVNNPDNYGSGWCLDHGGALSEGVLAESLVVSDLKWGSDVSSKRKAYLLRLLEQAVAWRARTPLVAGAVPSIPRAVEIVFTLPLRMRADVALFERDVKDVLKDLGSLTGVSFSPKFQWESIAGSVPRTTRIGSKVYAMVDLGGGSLDFWGCYFGTGGNGEWVQRADSLLLGGSDLLSKVSQTDGRAVDSILRNLPANGEPAALLAGINSYASQAHFFFTTVLEVVARWLACLCNDAKAQGSKAEELSIGLLGRAWSLGGSDWQNLSSAGTRLHQRTKQLLGSDVKFVWQASVPQGQIERKAYLARYVTGFGGEQTLAGTGHDYSGFVGTGLTLSLSGDSPQLVRWTEPLPFDLRDPAQQVLFAKNGRDYVPALPGVLGEYAERAEQQVQHQMNLGGSAAGGYRGLHGSTLLRSPFHHVVEQVVASWKAKP
jgi:hypothetical protein